MSRGEDTAPKATSVLRRIGRNAGWLMGGKGVGALLSLGYLAIAARSLGPEGFGAFVLALTYGQAVANLVQFQSWQTLIRFGAAHLVTDSRQSLIRLIAFTGMLDAASAVAGMIIAIAAVPLAGSFFQWSPIEERNAALFGISLLFALRATPTGILRLFDRFDLAAIAETVLPVMRLIGAVAALLSGAGVAGFLVAWGAAELATSAALWWAALRELSSRDLLQRPEPGWLKQVVAENAGLWRFAWLTNLSITLNLFWHQIAILAVGAVATPAVAGGFRLAHQLSRAMAKPVTSLARAGYPELAHLVAARSPQLASVLKRSAAISVLAAMSAVALVAVAGGPLLTLIAGADYRFAEIYLLLLSIAVAVELAGVVLEPLLLALGRPGGALGARAGAALIYLLTLSVLIELYGAVGAATATIVGSVAMVAFLGLVLWRTYPRRA